MPGTISRYYPPHEGEGIGRFAHLHENHEILLEPVDAEGDGQVDFRCPECDDRASIVFDRGSPDERLEHARRMAEESRRWGRDREALYWEQTARDAEG
jgi:hypothetical protein